MFFMNVIDSGQDADPHGPETPISFPPIRNDPVTGAEQVRRDVYQFFPNRDQSTHVSHPWWFNGVAVAFVVISAVGLVFPLVWSSLPTALVASQELRGEVEFLSSGQLTPNSAQGINDEVGISLYSLDRPAQGDWYNAWLMPDSSDDAVRPLLLGSFLPTAGKVHLEYHDPHHTDLLVNYSGLQVTEDPQTAHPDTPSLDPARLRYSGSIPMTPTPGDENHYSLLSHLHHLLAQDPDLQAIGLQGGLDIWLDRNSEKILEYATAARDDWPNTGGNADLTHREIVRILQYLDGVNYSYLDTPKGTPWLIDPHAGHIGLLDLVANQEPPGYVSHVLLHINGLINAPGATATQKHLAVLIDAAMQSIVMLYRQIRTDAITLVNMTDQQLRQPAALALLDSIATMATSAYTGQQGLTSSSAQPGIVAIHASLQTLGVFPVMRVTS